MTEPKKTFDFTQIIRDIPEDLAFEAGCDGFGDTALTDMFNFMHSHWPAIIHNYSNSGLNFHEGWKLDHAQVFPALISAAILHLAFESKDIEEFDYGLTMFSETAEAMFRYREMLKATGQVQDDRSFARFVGQGAQDGTRVVMASTMFGRTKQWIVEESERLRKSWNHLYEPLRIARMTMSDK